MPRRLFTLLIALALTWTALIALYGQTQTPAPRVGCQITPNKISTGDQALFTLFVDQTPPLTAYTLTLSYGPVPFAMPFADQDPGLEGFNLTPGGAFPADAISHNVVDTVKGEIQLAVSTPISSSITGKFDILATGIIQGVSSIVGTFRFTEVILRDHNGVVINRGSFATEECFVEIGNSGSPTPVATATYFLSPLLSATPTTIGHTSVAPTVTPTSTPGTPSPLSTSVLPTPTYTPNNTANTATPTFTPLPTATPTYTNTPEPTPTDTETPTPTVVAITNPASQSPLETPTPLMQEIPTESPVPTPTETETPTETATETPVPTDTPTVEAVPPTETPIPVPTDTPTREPTATPTSPAQIDRALGETVEVIAQSTPSSRPTQQPYRLLAVASLFGGLALLLAFWQLRRRHNE